MEEGVPASFTDLQFCLERDKIFAGDTQMSHYLSNKTNAANNFDALEDEKDLADKKND
jgi:hypothetical protein